jgi:hypothetical protein
MTTDPLAHERLRTILTDRIDAGFYQGGEIAEQADPDAVAGDILDAFPDAHFEYRTNDAGVAVRRVVAEGAWETDPAWPAEGSRCFLAGEQCATHHRHMTYCDRAAKRV